MEWGDKALDDLRGRIQSGESRMGELQQQLGEVRGDIRALDQKLDERADRMDEAHRDALKGQGQIIRKQQRIDWRTIVAIAGTVVVPIVVAIIAASQ